MTTVTKAIELDYGHTLPNHYSFCNQIHGHRAKVEATVEGPTGKTDGESSQGMVLDFKFLKKVMMEKIHDKLDHGFAVWVKDSKDLEFISNRNTRMLVTEDPPTAEVLAEWAFKQILTEVPGGVHLISVSWWETPTSVAIYRPSSTTFKYGGIR